MRRTAFASALTALALGVPCGAWWVLGSREAAQEASRQIDAPERLGRETAARLADRLGARLEALRAAESQRPFYHYQSLYHDPKGAHDGDSVVLSPLAEGPLDPLVRTYFQFDERGHASLPEYNPEVPELNRPERMEQQKQTLAELEPASVACRQTTSAIDATSKAQSTRDVAAKVEPQQEPSRRQPAQSPAQGPAQVQTLAREDWRQNAEASQVYSEIKSRKGGPSRSESKAAASDEPASKESGSKESGSKEPASKEPASRDPASKEPASRDPASRDPASREPASRDPASKEPASRDASPRSGAADVHPEDVRILTAPLEWRTIPLGGAPALVALREVSTPGGKLVQGFAVNLGAVADSFVGAPFPARLVAGEPSATPDPEGAAGARARVPLAQASWFVSVESTVALVAARESAHEVEQRFLATFLAGAVLAALAGLAVVGLVAQSERLARQRSRFAALAAHELRTPLAGLRIYGDMLAEGLGDPARHREYARRVADEAARLGRVVGNVLGFSRLERGTLAARPEEGDLAAFVREAIARQEAQLVAGGARLELILPEALPRARFDRDATAEILSNLLDNAEKYTRASPDRTIRVELTPTASGVALTVADRGPGVPRSTRKRLFRPFERGASSDAPAGLGLGLALARALARAQGGDLRHEARAGGGASFVVELPSAA